MPDTSPTYDAVYKRTIAYISTNWGSLKDLPDSLIPIVWVTVFRCLETSMTVESGGGVNALMKNTLIGDRKLAPRFDEAVLRIQLLQKLIPIIRTSTSQFDKLTDAQLLIDILKWNIIDAGSMSGLKRLIVRQFEKADAMYERPVPKELLA